MGTWRCCGGGRPSHCAEAQTSKVKAGQAARVPSHAPQASPVRPWHRLEGSRQPGTRLTSTSVLTDADQWPLAPGASLIRIAFAGPVQEAPTGSATQCAHGSGRARPSGRLSSALSHCPGRGPCDKEQGAGRHVPVSADGPARRSFCLSHRPGSVAGGKAGPGGEGQSQATAPGRHSARGRCPGSAELPARPESCGPGALYPEA